VDLAAFLLDGYYLKGYSCRGSRPLAALHLTPVGALGGFAGATELKHYPHNTRGSKMRLNVKAFALTCGLVWGIGLFFLTWWIIAFDGATGEPTLIGRLYRGYSISPAGSFIGLVWAFVDGLIIGAIFAWLYNLIAARTSGKEA